MQAIEFEAEIHNGSIKLPKQCDQWTERAVRVILLAKEPDDGLEGTAKRRQPHPAITGKGKTRGNLVGPIVSAEDWECLN